MEPSKFLLIAILLMVASASFAEYGVNFQTEEKCYFPSNRFPAVALRNPDGSVNTCFGSAINLFNFLYQRNHLFISINHRYNLVFDGILHLGFGAVFHLFKFIKITKWRV